MDTQAVLRRIKAKRQAAGLSQAELAARIGIRQPTYRDIEGGRIKLTLERLGEIATALGTSAESLITGTSSTDATYVVGPDVVGDLRGILQQELDDKLEASENRVIAKLLKILGVKGSARPNRIPPGNDDAALPEGGEDSSQ